MTTQLYRDTLASQRWRDLKWRRILQAAFACEGCGRRYHGRRVRGAMRAFHLHHKTYQRVGRESFDDVMVLCPICHRIEHNKIPEAAA